jgi:predicted RNA-binding Zn ribbon-like protein
MMVEPKSGRPIFKNVGGWLCLDFVNTQNWGTHELIYERFFNYLDFIRFSRHFGFLTEEEARRLRQEAAHRPEEAAAMFEIGLALRDLLHRIFTAIATTQVPAQADLDDLNQLLARALPHLHLVSTGAGFTWGWAKAETELEQVFWPVVYSAAELLTSEKLKRVGHCAGENCGWLFLDASRNHSRRWCEMQHCGNRVKARRHYRRKQGEGAQETEGTKGSDHS